MATLYTKKETSYGYQNTICMEKILQIQTIKINQNPKVQINFLQRKNCSFRIQKVLLTKKIILKIIKHKSIIKKSNQSILPTEKIKTKSYIY